MGLLDRVKRLFGAPAPAPLDAGSTLARGMASTQALSTQPLSTQPYDKSSPRSVAGEVPGYLLIQEELGRGAMAVVHAATDQRTQQRVAVKRLLLAAEVSPADLADAHARFLREAQAARSLTHPDILRVFDFGSSEGGDAWMVMELVQGHDLSHHVTPGQLLPVAQVLAIGIRLARALHHAHRQGVVHRDIKPANLMLDPASSAVRIMDFGIARIADGSRTRTGLVLGTPSYMAPEQLAGQTVDGRSDLYSLGAVLYQLLTGQLPHQSESMARLMHQIANQPVADVRSLRPGLPEALAMVLALALEKRPELRYANGEDLAQDLEAVLAQVQDTEGITSAAGSAAATSSSADIDPFAATQRIDLRNS
ncbi:MAG: serine/threonine protein kinase [Burkholderiales bacterium]|nr:serine/threonine protein kinase [Burkholderiales bacterium]